MVQEEHFLFLIDRLSSLNILSAAFIKDLRTGISERTYSRNQYVLSEGQEQSGLWFIANGFAREVSSSLIIPHGMTSWFWFSGGVIFQNGFFGNQKSLVDIEIYRGTTVLEISNTLLKILSDKYTEVPLLAEALRFDDYKKRKDYLSDLVNLKRIQHIQQVFHEHKILFNTALHKDLASYFGIKSHNLTRYLKDLK